MSDDLLDLQYLIDAINSLPGIGKKSAKKIANFLISQDDYYLELFMKRIKNAKQNISLCTHCNNFTENKNHICHICSSNNRDKSKICIVSHVEDLNVIEDTNQYNGLYYVLWGEINLRKNNSIEKLNVGKLFNQIKDNKELKEVIFATNLTSEGMITAELIYKECYLINKDLFYSRIGFGLPLNASIDYADNVTMAYSMKNRTKITK